MAPEFLIELEFSNVDFCGGRKTGEPGEKPSEQGREPITNSTHFCCLSVCLSVWQKVHPSTNSSGFQSLSESIRLSVCLLSSVEGGVSQSINQSVSQSVPLSVNYLCLSANEYTAEKTYEDMIDHRSYAHNLSSCEIKTCHLVTMLITHSVTELVTQFACAYFFLRGHLFQCILFSLCQGFKLWRDRDGSWTRNYSRFWW